MDRWITDWDVSPKYLFYTRANAGEVLPDPASPLAWTLVWEPGVVMGWYDAHLQVGTFEAEEFDPDKPEVIGLFGGYLYINAQTARLFGHRAPGLTIELIDQVYFGEHPDVPPYEHEDWHDSPGNTEKLGAWIGKVLTATDLPELREDRALADAAHASRPDLSTLTDAELVARARSFVPLLRHLFCRHLEVTAGGSVGPGILQGVAAAMGDPSIALRLMSAVGDVDSAAPSWAMWELSRQIRASDELRAAFAGGVTGVLDRLRASDSQAAHAFLAEWGRFEERFGSRGPNEWDIRSDTWETRPELALVLVERMVHQADADGPDRRNAERAADRQALVASITEALAADPEQQGMFLAALSSAAVYLGGRERTKTNIIKVVHEVRMAVRELGARHGYPASLVTMLLADELDDFVGDPESYRDRLLAREADYLSLFEREPPFIVFRAVAPVDEWPLRGGTAAEVAQPGAVLAGVPGCPGSAEGRARVLLDPSDPSALEPGDILVAPLTDPSWTPLFVPAAAVVVDVGAPASHAIIVSRELGIPCVVSVTGATRSIPDGALVRVDGDAGTVTVL